MKKPDRETLCDYSFDESPGVELGIKTLHGIGWNGLTQVTEQGVRFVVLFVLAHFLTPEDFGLVGLRLKDVAGSVAPAIAGAVILGVIVTGLRASDFVQIMDVNWRLTLLVWVGVTIYAGFTLLFRREFLAGMMDTLKQALEKPTSRNALA